LYVTEWANPASLLLVRAHTLGTVLNDVQFDAITFRQGYPRLRSLSNHEHVVQSCGECMSSTILKVNDFEGTWVALAMHDDANTSNTVSGIHHCNVANFKLDVIKGLGRSKIIADGVIHLSIWIWVFDCATIVSYGVWNTLGSLLDCLHLAELVSGLICANPVDGELPLCVIQETELFLGLFNRDDIHKTSRKEHVGAHLAIDLDQALHNNHLGLIVIQRILEAIAEEDDQRHALTQFVRSCRWARSENTTMLAQHPLGGREDAL